MLEFTSVEHESTLEHSAPAAHSRNTRYGHRK